MATPTIISRNLYQSAPDFLTRLEMTMAWLAAQWRTALALFLLATAVVAGVAWQEHRTLIHNQAASALYAQATKSAKDVSGTATTNSELLNQLVQNFGDTVPGAMARFGLARQHLDGKAFDLARADLTPLLERHNLPTFFTVAAMEWTAMSYELAGDFASAAKWYEQAYHHPDALNTATLLEGAVRNYRAAKDEAHVAAILKEPAPSKDTTDADQSNLLREIRLWHAATQTPEAAQ